MTLNTHTSPSYSRKVAVSCIIKSSLGRAVQNATGKVRTTSVLSTQSYVQGGAKERVYGVSSKTTGVQFSSAKFFLPFFFLCAQTYPAKQKKFCSKPEAPPTRSVVSCRLARVR